MHATGRFGNVPTFNGFAGCSGPDCVEGSNENDRIILGAGDDFARGSYGDDGIDGGDGNDTLEGGSDDDRLYGKSGVDRLEGGSGSDCHSGGLDNKRDVLDDTDGAAVDADDYVAEPGVVAGVAVETIDVITEATPWFVAECL